MGLLGNRPSNSSRMVTLYQLELAYVRFPPRANELRRILEFDVDVPRAL